MSRTLDFQLFFEESPDVLLVLLPDSPKFTAIAATKARLASTRSTLDQTIGHGLFELFPDNPDDPEAHATRNLRASLERVLATQAADTMAVQKYDIPLPDGGFEAKYWSPINIPILAADGSVQYILHRAVDVTELARASEEGEELRGKSADMEREVVRRSRELDAANRQLREANEKLNELDAAKTAFFSNISHEFRTPLTLMLGPLEESLADTLLSDAHTTRLRLAHDNALRSLKLVNALLDFSRLESGRLTGSFAPRDLSAVVREHAGMFQTAFDKAGIGLNLDCPTLSEPLWIDADMWEKIVPNLVSNAFKYTLTGAVTVRVRETATHAVLEVADTGCGIPAAELPRIFERFHRVAGAIGRTHEGTGIGLALVRELVELHGGTITADSTSGSGSVFRLEIPKGNSHLSSQAEIRVVPQSPAAPARNAHAVEAARWTGQLQSDTGHGEEDAQKPVVLVVDDNADLRVYISELLAANYRVRTATDGCEALRSIEESLPDIVVSDVMMPRMTGIELVQAIRANPATIALPIILLSARAGEEASAEGLDAGSDDYLTKPFTAHELRVRVRSHLKLAQARRQWISDLELANRELDAFSYSVAHDLRGPLRTIDGFSQMLQLENTSQLDDEGLRRFDMIRKAVQRMTQLIDDLLSLARMGRRELIRVPFDLAAVVRTVALQLSEAHPSRSIELVIAQPAEVYADPHLLQIALENLLGNAWKFTAKRASARVEFGSLVVGGETCFFIRDNGAGFDQKYASKLFAVFHRLHAASEFEGTGVGLATVKRVVARHGGRVWAEGEVGRGTTFYFSLGSAGVAVAPQSAVGSFAASG